MDFGQKTKSNCNYLTIEFKNEFLFFEAYF